MSLELNEKLEEELEIISEKVYSKIYEYDDFDDHDENEKKQIIEDTIIEELEEITAYKYSLNISADSEDEEILEEAIKGFKENGVVDLLNEFVMKLIELRK